MNYPDQKLSDQFLGRIIEEVRLSPKSPRKVGSFVIDATQGSWPALYTAEDALRQITGGFVELDLRPNTNGPDLVLQYMIDLSGSPAEISGPTPIEV